MFKFFWAFLNRIYNWLFPIQDNFLRDINVELNKAISFAEYHVREKTIQPDKISASLEYLRRRDVRRQAIEFCRKLDVIEMETAWRKRGETYFIEMIVTNDKKEQYILSYWPCPGCACVSCKPKP